MSYNTNKVLYTSCSKKGRHQTHVSNSVNSQPVLQNTLTIRFSSKFAAKFLLKIPSHLICVATLPCETLLSENEWQSQTNAVKKR